VSGRKVSFCYISPTPRGLGRGIFRRRHLSPVHTGACDLCGHREPPVACAKAAV
jgi:hypothetical protein